MAAASWSTPAHASYRRNHPGGDDVGRKAGAMGGKGDDNGVDARGGVPCPDGTIPDAPPA